jgi:hypothetical protein
MSGETDLFGDAVPVEPGYQSARSEAQSRMFDFPVTLPGQMALDAPEGPSDAKVECVSCGHVPILQDGKSADWICDVCRDLGERYRARA